MTDRWLHHECTKAFPAPPSSSIAKGRQEGKQERRTRCGCPSRRSRCSLWRRQDSTCTRTRFRSPSLSQSLPEWCGPSDTYRIKFERVDDKVISNCKSLSGENSFSMRCLYAIACEINTKQTRNTLSTVVIGEGITLGMTKNRL